MKKSMFAKLLIMILCLALVLCGCGDSASNSGDDKDQEKNTVKVEVNGDDDKDTTPEDNDNENVEPVLTPEEKADMALENTLNAIFSSDSDFSGLEDALEAGKLTITVGDYVDNVLYIDGNNMELADELSLNIEGVALDVQLFVNEDALVVAMPGAVDGAYGIKFDTLATDLENSAIWELMGISYEDFMTQLGASLDELTGMLDSIDPTMNDLAGALEDALSGVDKTVSEGAVEVNGKDVNAVIVTYSMDSDAMHNMVDVMIDWYVEYMESMSNSMSAYLDEDMSDMLAEIEGAKDDVDAFFADADLKAELVVNINAETGYIMTAQGEFSGVVEGEEGGVYLDVNLGENIAESDELSFVLSDGEEMNFSILMNREINGTETVYELSATMAEAGEEMEMLNASLTYDSASYEYEVAVEIDGDVLAANGIFKLTDDVFELTVDTVAFGGESVAVDFAMALEAVSATEIPKMPSYTNILTMSADDLQLLIMELYLALS